MYIKANETGGVKEKIEFDYTDYRWEAVKYFLDCMHMITPDPTNMTIILETLDMAHSEGKTTYDSFERHLSGRLMSAILNESFTLGTELLIAAFLSKVDNLDETYHTNLAVKVTKDFYTELFTRFDVSNELNKQLIEMCVTKGIFDDNSRKSVMYTLTVFGEDLQRIYALPSSFEYEMATFTNILFIF